MRRTFPAMLLVCFFYFCATAENSVAAKDVKDWTFLVYLNGHNSLDQFGPMNIKQMEKVGSNANLNIVVEWGSMQFPTVKRLLIQKSTNPNAVTSPVVNDAGNVDMGDYHSLIEFVRWAQVNYPARHYMIDVWDHGSGWHAKQGKNVAPFDISWDDRTGHSITTLQLGQAMTEISHILGQKVDIYASDACMMAMAEIATEMQDSVRMFVNSEELEPGEGWPYDDFLTKWTALANPSAADISKLLVTSYVNAYKPGGEYSQQDATMSAVDLEKWGEFLTAVKDFAGDLRRINAADKASVLAAANGAQAFYTDDYKDLIDFAKRLESAHITSINPQSLTKLKELSTSAVIAAGATSSFHGAFGMAFWLPTMRSVYGAYSRSYGELAFDKATSWGDTLNFLLPAH